MLNHDSLSAIKVLFYFNFFVRGLFFRLTPDDRCGHWSTTATTVLLINTPRGCNNLSNAYYIIIITIRIRVYRNIAAKGIKCINDCHSRRNKL